MWKWIKNIFVRQRPQERIMIYPLSEEEQDDEIKELILLQDDICGKHHG